MEKLFKNLAWYCVENGLGFNYTSNIGAIYIHDHMSVDCEIVTHGYIKDWEHESQEETLTRMHSEVTKYLQGADKNG